MCKKLRWNIDCKEATYLMEVENSDDLTRLSSFRLRVHLITCKSCREFRAKWKTIIKRLQSLNLTDLNRFSEVEKIQLQKKINQKL